MQQEVVIILITWAAGVTALLGGFVARIETFKEGVAKQEFVHGIIAFGGGALLAAVAFALTPHAMAALSPLTLALSFCAGALLFFALDGYLAKRGGAFSQFLAMLMDFVPEAISLGAIFTHNRKMGLVLAAFIGLQNFPEGFNAFRELKKSGVRAGTILWVFLGVSFLGPLAALTGYYFLQGQEQITAIIMSFAAGGILYLIFQDIAPQAVMRRHWSPPLGAVLGFLIGMLGTAAIS
ncbi:ZIP family metal transporter [Gilvimarinus polysaccharolyticus]|uniref:ZIP family metal transporter n=1 Tax=Gilvimarinus polysaccharolyticus TaxID=863921 RepID=UPI000673B497|nr:ZIP family metal transporter [Gilvimarinus polysaccharolyticus]